MYVECGAQAVEHMHATLLKGVDRTSLARKLPSPVAARAAAAVAAATRMLDEQGLAGNATNATNATVCVCVCVCVGNATNAMNIVCFL
jgi:ribosomal protein S12 methylthiotransferase accessory factor YcaO